VATKTSLSADLVCIDHVDLSMTSSKLTLKRGRELRLEGLQIVPSAVNDEGTALLQVIGKRILGDVGRMVDCNVVSLRDRISRSDLLRTETQMACCDTTSLVSSEEEVTLRVQVSVHSNELDCKTVGTDSTIAAKAPEDALLCALRNSVDRLANNERSVADIISDTNSEAVLRLSLCKVVVDSSNHGRGESLVTKTEATTDDLNVASKVRVEDAGADVEVERLTARARLLGTVENSNALDGLGEGGKEVLGTPWAEEVDLADTNLCVEVLVEVICSLNASTAAGTHEADDTLCILRTNVLKERQMTASDSLTSFMASSKTAGASRKKRWPASIPWK